MSEKNGRDSSSGGIAFLGIVAGIVIMSLAAANAMDAKRGLGAWFWFGLVILIISVLGAVVAAVKERITITSARQSADNYYEPSPEPNEGDDSEKAESNRGEIQATSHLSQIYEADIQEFIVKNINLLEDGLRVIEQHKKISKDNKVIGEMDILCKDMDGDYVVVEVKKGVAKREVAGQIATYWGWVKENLPTGKEPRGIIVASGIDAQLELALIPFGSKIQAKVFGKLPPLESNMRHCDKCGQLIPKSASSCRSCGSKQWM